MKKFFINGSIYLIQKSPLVPRLVLLWVLEFRFPLREELALPLVELSLSLVRIVNHNLILLDCKISFQDFLFEALILIHDRPVLRLKIFLHLVYQVGPIFRVILVQRWLVTDLNFWSRLLLNLRNRISAESGWE